MPERDDTVLNLNDIFSLSDFQRRTREHIRRMRSTGRPEVLTVNGRAELVVYDAATYQEVAEELERARADVRSRGPVEARSDSLIEAYKKDVDRTLLRENLARSVQERVDELIELQRLSVEAKRAGRGER